MPVPGPGPTGTAAAAMAGFRPRSEMPGVAVFDGTWTSALPTLGGRWIFKDSNGATITWLQSQGGYGYQTHSRGCLVS